MIRYNIVPMVLAHTEQIAELERQCFSDPWSLQSVQNELKNPLSTWLVAETDGTVLGYVGAQTAADESDIMNLAVHPQHRRCGIGKELLLTLQKNLTENGSMAITLEVRMSNLTASSLYEKMGFQTVGRRPNYYFHPREDAIIMRKELKHHENSCN